MALVPPSPADAVALSVIIPVFNEEANLKPLLGELRAVLEATGQSHEVLCVDDCSTDNSLAVLRRLQAGWSALRIVRHRLNQGESAAQATGFRVARGAILITMDGDQQNDPADIPMFLQHLTPEVACVCGWRQKRKDSLTKKISSRLANGFRRALTGDTIHDAGCTYRALRRAVVQELPVFNGLHRFIPTILRYQGQGVIEVAVHHRPRTRGVSKYGVGNRLWRGIRDCLALRWYRARLVRSDRLLTVEEPAPRA